jgi:pyruvate/2-oxoglutarate dehydrogenase complex dihydrolipoamide dehydrogenase (E3) component
MTEPIETREPLVAPDDAFNRELVAKVHPDGWRNPRPGGRYNLVVVGAGTAGLVTAAGAASLGARVALVERHLMGGDCLNYGCVPSKAVIRASRAAHEARHAAEFGVESNQPVAVNFARAMERLRRLRAGISEHDSAARMAGLGVDVFLGSARFTGRDTVEVAGETLRFSRAVIATGARAAVLDVPGLAEAGFLTNETVFSLTAAPRRLLVVGGGPIGCELAQAFRRLGSDVTLLTDVERLLPREETEAAEILARRFAEEGMAVVTSVRLRQVERVGGERMVTYERQGATGRVATDEILLCVGRAANVEGLGLEAAGVRYNSNGVEVDDRLRTSNPRIYAAGDVCSPYKFTHAADAMARIVIQNALFFGRKKASGLVIPWCTYTDPEIARVGLDPEGARRRGHEVATFAVPLADVDRAVLDGQTEGFARVHIEKKSGRILGATLVSAHAGETIGEVVLAMTQGLGIGALRETIHPYPTQAEALKRAADLSLRSRLTPGRKALLTRFLSWRR